MNFLSRLLIHGLLIISPTLAFASWEQDFEVLKNRPAYYEDAGTLCEELARIKVSAMYPDSPVLVGIEYEENGTTLGELDVVVFSSQNHKVEHIFEVKCWRNLNGGLEKAQEQRRRFKTHLSKPNGRLRFISLETSKSIDANLFGGDVKFSTIGQRGSVAVGYDLELEYDFKELKAYSMELIRCQDRRECARP